ncbi:NUDIX domain-containing protein [Candidatus Woesearchaeota archaeon]|nr:NUDIX domain-containing protein [Candidatus Woesearchaeota archaeon]
MKNQQKVDLTAAGCAVYENKVLLLHHAKLDKWLFPGGHIEINETPDEAVVREFFEETGLKFIFKQHANYPPCNDEIKRCAIPLHANLHSVGDHDHYGLFYLGTVEHPNFVRNNESKDIKWYTEEEITQLQNVPDATRQMALHALHIAKNK